MKKGMNRKINKNNNKKKKNFSLKSLFNKESTDLTTQGNENDI